jgi:hypothetical protein
LMSQQCDQELPIDRAIFGNQDTGHILNPLAGATRRLIRTAKA